MSVLDDKSKEVFAEAADKAGTDSFLKVKDKKQGSGSWKHIILFFIIGLAVSLLVGWKVFPELLYSEKNQPIDFNHVLHVEVVEEGCKSCHFFREDGSFSGVPKLARCVDCHEDIQGENPEEAKFVEEYVTKQKEVPWLIYSKQPDCVFFPHIAHVKMGGIECNTCHGPIGESTHSKVYEENRITGYSRDIWGKNAAGLKKNTWDRMKMDACIECHVKNKAASKSAETIPSSVGRIANQPANRQVRAQGEADSCFVCHK